MPGSRARRRPRDPEPPQDVRLELPDGRRIPVECVYVGLIGGQHTWEAVTPKTVRLVNGRIRLTAKVIPAHTSIRVPLELLP